MSCLNDKMTSFEHAKNDKKKQTYNVKKNGLLKKEYGKLFPSLSFLPLPFPALPLYRLFMDFPLKTTTYLALCRSSKPFIPDHRKDHNIYIT